MTLTLSIGVVYLTAMVVGSGSVPVRAQNRMTFSIASPQSGHIALGLAIRKLSVSGTFVQAVAHPDDENSALFALFGYGMGLRVIGVQNNRGEGSDNRIGPELFHDMAVLRTSELLSVHRIDGAEQYFTRAIDFGYRWDLGEVIGKWGRKDNVGDYVRLWRTLRPDVIVTMNIQGSGGNRSHEATAVLVRESIRAAGDPSMYPEQLQEGLRPWQPKKLYFTGALASTGGPGTGSVALTPVSTETYDNLLGRTYAEIGSDAHSFHKCQMGSGRGAASGSVLGASNGRRGGGGGSAGVFGNARGYSLVETTIAGEMQKQESSLFEGIDTNLLSIANYAGSNPPRALMDGLTAILEAARQAQTAFAQGNDAATAAPIEAGLTAVRSLEAQLGSMGLSDSARYEIDFRLKQKERDYQDAVLAAHDLTFDALADDGLVIAGQPVQLFLTAVNHGPTEVSVTGVQISGFDSPASCAPDTAKKDATYSCVSAARIPKDAKPMTSYFSDNYWNHPENQAIQIFDPSVPFGVPFAPSPFRVTFHVKAGSVEVAKDLPVEYRYVKDIYFGDKRMEMNVVPDFSARITSALAVIPAPAGATKTINREIYVSVTNGTKGAAKAVVALELPSGWKSTPATAEINFGREDESLSARFMVSLPPRVKTGAYTFRAVVTSPGYDKKFTEGYEAIEYPHIERQQVIKPAEIPVKVVDVKIAPNLNVGYIEGVGDQVPAAIEQLGAKVTMIDKNELAWGDLSKYDVIVTGIRAYEERDDLRAYNQRVLDYARRGGTIIVQYGQVEFNQVAYAPYPARVDDGIKGVSDASAPVKVLVPDNPVFNTPNRIGPATWANWVQDRGLFFLGEKDPKYIDLISMVDTFKDNPGEQLGSLVEAKTGRGHWIYVGLGLWRQLPAGTTGAYQLLANLLSLGKAPATASRTNTVAAR